jgi:hypothetical protein
MITGRRAPRREATLATVAATINDAIRNTERAYETSEGRRVERTQARLGTTTTATTIAEPEAQIQALPSPTPEEWNALIASAQPELNTSGIIAPHNIEPEMSSIDIKRSHFIDYYRAMNADEIERDLDNKRVPHGVISDVRELLKDKRKVEDEELARVQARIKAQKLIEFGPGELYHSEISDEAKQQWAAGYKKLQPINSYKAFGTQKANPLFKQKFGNIDTEYEAPVQFKGSKIKAPAKPQGRLSAARTKIADQQTNIITPKVANIQGPQDEGVGESLSLLRSMMFGR